MSGSGSTEPKPSSVLLEKVNRINKAYGNLKNEVIEAYDQAISEGFSPEGAKTFIFENTEFSKRTIYRYLPDEAKDKHMQEIGRIKSLPTGNGEDIAYKLDEIRTYFKSMNQGGAGEKFAEELEATARVIEGLSKDILKIAEKVKVYRPSDPKRDILMARNWRESISEGMFSWVNDFVNSVSDDVDKLISSQKD
jgi:hypothetical protein